jgi:HSP20 family protein
MARNKNDDRLMEDELAAAFLDDNAEDIALVETEEIVASVDSSAEPSEEGDDGWDTETEDFPGQLAVDVYETPDKLIVKARTAGISRSDLDVSISDNILTISGVLNGGEDEKATNWHIQECYWGEFSRTIALPVQIKEDGVEAVLKDGVLTISFVKEKVTDRIKIPIN